MVRKCICHLFSWRSLDEDATVICLACNLPHLCGSLLWRGSWRNKRTLPWWCLFFFFYVYLIQKIQLQVVLSWNTFLFWNEAPFLTLATFSPFKKRTTGAEDVSDSDWPDSPECVRAHLCDTIRHIVLFCGFFFSSTPLTLSASTSSLQKEKASHSGHQSLWTPHV